MCTILKLRLRATFSDDFFAKACDLRSFFKARRRVPQLSFCTRHLQAGGIVYELTSGSLLTLTCGQEQRGPAPAQMPAATHDSPMAPHDLQTNQKPSPLLVRKEETYSKSELLVVFHVSVPCTKTCMLFIRSH